MVQQHMSGSVLTLTLTAGVVYCNSTDVTHTLIVSVLIFTLKLKYKKNTLVRSMRHTRTFLENME